MVSLPLIMTQLLQMGSEGHLIIMDEHQNDLSFKMDTNTMAQKVHLKNLRQSESQNDHLVIFLIMT